MTYELKTVPCTTCGEPTSATSIKRCGSCWELEHRLIEYLRRGGANARAFVAQALHAACEAAS